MRTLCLFCLFLISFNLLSQENEENKKNNLQVFTPSKLLNKGQWDVKWFNGLYTETRQTGENSSRSRVINRRNFFTTTLEVFTGIDEDNRVNLGGILEFRSNTFEDRQALSVFNINHTSSGRKGLTSFAPSVKIQPFKDIGNFSIQTAIFIPLLERGDEQNPDGFLAQTVWSFQNRFFYDYTFASGKWQLFTELNTMYAFGDAQSFANNTFLIVPGIFMSYFPTQKATVLAFTQHGQRFGNFEQNNTTLGFGGKYQLTDVLNIEILYGNIVRGYNFQGLGETYSLGLRALF